MRSAIADTRQRPAQDVGSLRPSMEAEMDKHRMSGDDVDVDEIALMIGQFDPDREQVRWKPWKALVVGFDAGAVAIGAAVVLLTSMGHLAALR